MDRTCYKKFIFLVFLFELISLVLGHARWVYPTPRSSNPGLKSYPCGGIAASTSVTTIDTSTGSIELKWEETITHSGAPFAIAISQDGITFYTILDHIPHQDVGGASTSSTKKYALSFQLPNINCNRCILQLVNPMTDKISSGTCCKYYPNSDSTAFSNSANPLCFSVYHSCADVTLTGANSFASFVANRTTIGKIPCGDYMTQSSNQWVVGGDGYNRLTGFTGSNIQSYVTNTCSGFNAYCTISSSNSTGGGGSNTFSEASTFSKAFLLLVGLLLVLSL